MKVDPIIDNEEITDLITYLNWKNPRNAVLFATGIYTGLRIGDILEIRVKDIYKRNKMHIKQQKTKNYVDIELNRNLKKIVKEYVEDSNLKPYDYLFRSRQGHNKPISRQRAYQIIKEGADYLGIENIGTHSMRKTAGYHAYKMTKDVGLVMEMLGQKDTGSTLRYIGVTNKSVNDVRKKLNY